MDGDGALQNESVRERSRVAIAATVLSCHLPVANGFKLAGANKEVTTESLVYRVAVALSRSGPPTERSHQGTY